MRESALRVGIIGAGFGRAIHLVGFRRVPGVEVAGLVASTREKSRRIATEEGLDCVYKDWSEMLADESVDAITITTPPDLHHLIGKEALRRGKAVLCEKPLAMNAAEAEELASLARTRGAVGMVHFEFRFIPAWRLFKRCLENGAVGVPRKVQITWHVQSWADASRAWSWQCDEERGGGVLGALAVHTFDYIRWLFGEVRSVSASLETRIASRPAPAGPSPVTAEDTVDGMMMLDSGIPLAFSISNVLHQPRGHWVEVYGDRGTLVLGSENLKDYVYGFKVWEGRAGRAGLQELPVPPELNFPETFADGRLAPFIAVATAFADAVRKGEQIPPSFDDGLHAQRICDAVRRSHRERRWMDLPPTGTEAV